MINNSLKLVTSNLNKLAEFKRFGIKNISVEEGLDLKEVDSDELNVILYKALEAGKNRIVEDTSLSILNADIGVNVRWMLDNLENYEGKQATWNVLLGHNDGDFIHVYKGEIEGKIVKAKKNSDGFGFDNVFKPKGSRLTLNELEKDGYKDKFSARKEAVDKFKVRKPLMSISVSKIPVWKGPYQNQ